MSQPLTDQHDTHTCSLTPFGSIKIMLIRPSSQTILPALYLFQKAIFMCMGYKKRTNSDYINIFVANLV